MPPLAQPSALGGGPCLVLSLIAPSHETPPVIDDYVPGDCRVCKGGIVLVYDRSGAAESVVQVLNVHLFCVKQTVVASKILYSILHDLPLAIEPSRSLANCAQARRALSELVKRTAA